MDRENIGIFMCGFSSGVASAISAYFLFFRKRVNCKCTPPRGETINYCH